MMPEAHDLLQSIQGLFPRIDDVLTALDNAAPAWTTYRELSDADHQAKARFNGEIDPIQLELRGAEWDEIAGQLAVVFEHAIEPTHKLYVDLSYEVMDALRSLPAAPAELRATRDEIERLQLSVGLLIDLRTDGGGRKHAQPLPLEDRRRDLLSMKCRLIEMERLISGEPAHHPPAVAASSNERGGHRETRHYVDKRHEECALRLKAVLEELSQHEKTKDAALRQWLNQHRTLSRTAVTDYLGCRIEGNISTKKRAEIEEAILNSD